MCYNWRLVGDRLEPVPGIKLSYGIFSIEKVTFYADRNFPKLYMKLNLNESHASGRRWPVLRPEGGIWNFWGDKANGRSDRVFLELDSKEKICYNIKKRLL